MYLGSKQTAKHDHQNMAAERESKDSALVYGYERILQDCIHAFATKLESLIKKSPIRQFKKSITIGC